MNHSRPSGIERCPDLLLAVLADGDAATIDGPDLRAGTTIADAEFTRLAEQFQAYGFDAADLDRYIRAFTTADTARALAQWADREARPRVRRVLVISLCCIGEAR